jgi:hypothetical protein
MPLSNPTKNVGLAQGALKRLRELFVHARQFTGGEGTDLLISRLEGACRDP